MLTFEGGPEKLNVAIATNTAPDVIYDAPGRIIDWGKKGLLAPLNDMMPDEVKNDISPALMKAIDGWGSSLYVPIQYRTIHDGCQ